MLEPPTRVTLSEKDWKRLERTIAKGVAGGVFFIILLLAAIAAGVLFLRGYLHSV